MLDNEGAINTPSHKGIPGNEKANQASKKVLDEDITTNEK
jgi:hypothetical protein